MGLFFGRSGYPLIEENVEKLCYWSEQPCEELLQSRVVVWLNDSDFSCDVEMCSRAPSSTNGFPADISDELAKLEKSRRISELFSMFKHDLDERLSVDESIDASTAAKQHGAGCFSWFKGRTKK
mmetsp:Transcript_72383/g.193443  ORF Transcript_72383/g.193443 Transcript_72383/m.193443 type:complete len:124 (+) Transcript_72383:92-463(+)